jgi:hypothetical protein
LKAKEDVLQVQLTGPAYRQPAEFEVTWTAEKVSVKVTRAARVRLAHGVLRPEWPGKDKLVLERNGPDGPVAVGSGAAWENNGVEWQAVPGVYELRPAKK